MSNTVIQIKRSAVTATPNTLSPGELAFSYVSNTLFIGDTTGNVISIVVADQANLLNVVYNTANAAYAEANLANTIAQTALVLANTAENQANLAYATANVAVNIANLAYAQANAALIAANSKFSANGGTISGDVNITGNLIVSGIVSLTLDGGSF